MVKLSDGLIKFLQDYTDKTVTVVLKKDGSTVTGRLVGFDSSVILLNPFEKEDESKLSGSPMFIDLDYASVITTPLKEKDLDVYKKSFEEFQKEYAAGKKIMKAVYAAETI